MTTQRDFKRVVRARMTKTGESYTAARATLLKQASRAPVPPSEYARLAGMTDAALKAKTGCGWEKWVHSLDHVNASAWPHREIARYVRETYKQPSWWAQTVAVGYERVRGLRDAGQRRDGRYVVNKSRTFDVGVGALYRAVREPRMRAKWLPGVTVAMRSATAGKVVRMTLVEDGTSVEVRFESKGRGRGTVVLQHEGVGTKEEAARLRAWWGERLEALGLLLTAPPSAKRAPTARTARAIA